MAEHHELQDILDRGHADGVATHLVLLLWDRGLLAALAAGEATTDTIFDLASLTKPLATAVTAWDLMRRGGLDWELPLGELLGPALPGTKREITIRRLLCHAAGFPAHQPYFQALANQPPWMRPGLLQAMLANEPLAHPPGSRALYSDLGYLLLGLILARATGGDLAAAVSAAHANLGAPGLVYAPTQAPPPWDLARVAPCGPLPGRPVIHGQVEDENAHALGGVAGHAGLFGTAGAVAGLLSALSVHPEAAPLWLVDAATPGSARTPGFDTPQGPDSAAGPNAPSGTVGHLGFTGVSAWWHPTTDRGVVLLTNRVVFGRDNLKIQPFRRQVHELAWRVLGA